MTTKICQQMRTQMEASAAAAELGPVARHVQECAGCAEYAALQHWSSQVLNAGRLEVAPPALSAVWASIHRARELGWDSALSRSFRRLVPFMVAIVAVIVLLGGLNPAPSPATAVPPSPFAVFNAPETSHVVTILTADASAQDPAELLGVDR